MNINKQSGLSLVEILIALVISLFLLAGVIQVYVANKSTYQFSEGLSRIQENARFTMDIMKRDLRMAGFRGCATENFVNNLDQGDPGYNADLHDFFNEPPLEGTENDGLNGSDSITIRGVAPGQANVVPPYNSPTSAQIHASANSGIEVGDIVLLSNCRGADVFQVTGVTQGSGTAKLSVGHNTGNTQSPGNYNPGNCGGGNAHCLSQTYGGDSALLKLQAVIYTIATGTSGEPALFRQENNGPNVELVDGIEQLQVLYGVDTNTGDTSPNQYVTSTNVADWEDVTAVRIMLLARSPNNVSMDDPQQYFYNGQNLTSGDQRLRQVFSTTIALRNRI